MIIANLAFFSSLVLVTTNGVISNVKGMVPSWNLWVVTAFNYKRVALSSNNVYFRDQQAINEPGDAPTNVT